MNMSRVHTEASSTHSAAMPIHPCSSDCGTFFWSSISCCLQLLSSLCDQSSNHNKAERGLKENEGNNISLNSFWPGCTVDKGAEAPAAWSVVDDDDDVFWFLAAATVVFRV